MRLLEYSFMNLHVTNCLVGYSRCVGVSGRESEITFVSYKYVSREMLWFLNDSDIRCNGKTISLL